LSTGSYARVAAAARIPFESCPEGQSVRATACAASAAVRATAAVCATARARKPARHAQT
jgi:hypothetical protein